MFLFSILFSSFNINRKDKLVGMPFKFYTSIQLGEHRSNPQEIDLETHSRFIDILFKYLFMIFMSVIKVKIKASRDIPTLLTIVFRERHI